MGLVAMGLKEVDEVSEGGHGRQPLFWPAGVMELGQGNVLAPLLDMLFGSLAILLRLGCNRLHKTRELIATTDSSLSYCTSL